MPPLPRRTISALLLIATTLFLLAALSLSCQTSHAQTTNPMPKKAVALASQPTTAPAGRIVHVSLSGAPDTLTIDKAFNQVRSGDTIILHSGDTYIYATAKKGINDVTLMTDGADPATLAVPRGNGWPDAGQDALTLMLCNDWNVSNIRFVWPHRDPRKSDFQKLSASNCVHLIQSCGNHFSYCTFDWGQNDLTIEGSNVTGNTFDHCDFGPAYAIPGPDGKLPHAQNVFMSGQVGTTFIDCTFDYAGWFPGVAEPNIFDHSIYNHDGNRDKYPVQSGPYTALRCQFTNAASSGPTGDAGGSYIDCVILDCMNTPGAPAAWTTNGTISGCIANGKLQSTGKSVKILNNVLLNSCPVISWASNTVNTRTAADVVEVGGNVCFGSPIACGIDGQSKGTNNIHDNVALPANPNLESVVRQAAKARAGQ